MDAPYFHVVFTVPEELNPIIYSNQKFLYTALYHAASDTLSELAADSKYLGDHLDRKKKLFPVVFPMIFHIQKFLYTALYHAASDTLSELAADSKYLGTDIFYICATFE